MEKLKRIPYGVSNFVDIIQRNLYFVDKTMYIPKLEAEPDSLFFIRPRRFGKSLFLSMLRAYYDINMKDRFQELFGNLWIGSHATPLQGNFQILYLDFSQIGGSIDKLEENFNTYCNICLDDFMDNYKRFYPAETVKTFYEFKVAKDKLALIRRKSENSGIPLYLIIDEYDNFTNVVLNEHGEKVYWALTHASGFYSDIFRIFKGMFTRTFMMGVNPIILNDLNNGYNIGWHISDKCAFNQMLGFSTEDVREMFEYYKENGGIRTDCDVDAVIGEMTFACGNYCFSKDALKPQSKVFNCNMALYYLCNYMEVNDSACQMLALNTKNDLNKVKNLFQLGKLDSIRKSIICQIAEKGEITSTLETCFPANALIKPSFFVSLLFYNGILTIQGTFGDMFRLCIPNNIVRQALP